MAKKVIRKKIPLGTDEFVTSRSSIFKYLSENFKIVAVATSVIALLVLSYAGWSLYSSARDKKAGELLYSALKVYKAKVEPSSTAADAFKNEEDKYKAAVDKFTDVSKAYKGSSLEPVALLYAANSYYNVKKFDKAIEIYNRILFKIDREDPSLHGNVNEIKASPGIVRDAALNGLAFSYEQKGDLKAAIEAETSLTSSKDSFLREAGLITLGRFYEKSNDKAKALEAYQKVISDYPESPNLAEVKLKVERLKG